METRYFPNVSLAWGFPGCPMDFGNLGPPKPEHPSRQGAPPGHLKAPRLDLGTLPSGIFRLSQHPLGGLWESSGSGQRKTGQPSPEPKPIEGSQGILGIFFPGTGLKALGAGVFSPDFTLSPLQKVLEKKASASKASKIQWEGHLEIPGPGQRKTFGKKGLLNRCVPKVSVGRVLPKSGLGTSQGKGKHRGNKGFSAQIFPLPLPTETFGTQRFKKAVFCFANVRWGGLRAENPPFPLCFLCPGPGDSQGASSEFWEFGAPKA